MFNRPGPSYGSTPVVDACQDTATSSSLPIVSPYILELERQLMERQAASKSSLAAAVLADSNRFSRNKQSDMITSEGIPILETIGHEFDNNQRAIGSNGKARLGNGHHINQPNIGGLETTSFQALLSAVRAGKTEAPGYSNPFAGSDISPPPSAPSSAPYPFYVRGHAVQSYQSDYANRPYPSSQAPPSQFLPRTGQHNVPRFSESYLKRRYIRVGHCRIERTAQLANDELRRRLKRTKLISWSLMFATVKRCLRDTALTIFYVCQILFLLSEASVFLVFGLWQKCVLATACLQDWIGKAAGEE